MTPLNHLNQMQPKQEYLSALERQKIFSDNQMVNFNALIQIASYKFNLWSMSDKQIILMEQA